MKKIALLTMSLLALSLSSCKQDGMLPRDNHISKLSQYDSKADEIIAQMTLEEKVAMLHGKHMFTSEGVPRLGIADMIYADGPFAIREEMEPHSWNSLHLSTDSSTFFPTGSALAATWSPELAYQYGKGLAVEARLRGKDMLLGPAINIQRIPTGGRTYEYFSEDPFLSARLSVGYTQGVQDNGVAVCLKHYALNNQENNRGTVNVIASPRAMREIYLPPFEAAVVEADAYGVMAAYNKVNGYWCAENDFLQNQVLRRDWGFKGMVISDWGGTHSTVASIKNGLNVEMPNQQYLGQALLDSVKAGAVSEDIINQRVKEILRVRFAIEPIPAEKANVELTAKPEQAQIAYDVAAKSIVLLKNETNLLPINFNKVKKIAVIGDNANRKMASGGVGAGAKAHKEYTPMEGIQNIIGNKAEIVYAQGYEIPTRPRWGMQRAQAQTDNSAALREEALKVAKDADLVLFIGGNNREIETEGSDRADIMLKGNQDELVKALSQVNPNLVTILVAAAPVDLNVVEPCSPTILVSWFNGSQGGNALADVLVGNVVPSGKLPFTYPVKLEDSPAYATGSYPQTDAPIAEDIFVALVGEKSQDELMNGSSNRTTALYAEDLLVGYRWFDTKNVKPMYPFGHGLSYTSFEYSDLKATKEKYSEKEDIQVSFILKNTGSVDADEVVQLYVHRLDATVEWPYKELKAFDRVTVKAGESVEVKLNIPVEHLKYWSEEDYNWMLEHGKIELLLGSSSADIRLSTQVQI